MEFKQMSPRSIFANEFSNQLAHSIVKKPVIRITGQISIIPKPESRKIYGGFPY